MLPRTFVACGARTRQRQILQVQRLEKRVERVRVDVTGRGVLRTALEGSGKRFEWHVPVLCARLTVEAPDGSVREPPGPHGHIMGSRPLLRLYCFRCGI